MPRLNPDLEAGIVAAIKAGKLASIICTETGAAESTVRWIAAKHGLRITKRYSCVREGTYWRKYWGSAKLR